MRKFGPDAGPDGWAPRRRGGGRRPKKGSWWVNTHRLMGQFGPNGGLVGVDPLWGSLP